jgi:chemotaxis protein methyltransferase CheR
MPSLDKASFQAIAELMHRTVGLVFADSKQQFVEMRLSGRVRALNLPSYRHYFERIADANEDGEFQIAVDLLTTNETYFFREQAHFDLLEREWARLPRRPITVWSAASSFGDEVYSLAMLLSDLQLKGQVAPGWSVSGTDISDRALREAVRGVYPESRLRNVSPERLRRHGLRSEQEHEHAGEWQVGPELRSRVRFGRVNLCEPFEDMGRFDVVLLRNVLIYFDSATRLQVVDRVLQQLRPGGLFLLGIGEGRVASSYPLEVVAPGAWRLVNED